MGSHCRRARLRLARRLQVEGGPTGDGRGCRRRRRPARSGSTSRSRRCSSRSATCRCHRTSTNRWGTRQTTRRSSAAPSRFGRRAHGRAAFHGVRCSAGEGGRGDDRPRHPARRAGYVRPGGRGGPAPASDPPGYGAIDADGRRRVNQARRSGGRVVAVGTTSVRTLETAAAPPGRRRRWPHSPANRSLHSARACLSRCRRA